MLVQWVCSRQSAVVGFVKGPHDPVLKTTGCEHCGTPDVYECGSCGRTTKPKDEKEEEESVLAALGYAVGMVVFLVAAVAALWQMVKVFVAG